MIGLRPPSLQREYDDFWSGDPALLQPPMPPDETASDELKKAWLAEITAHAELLQRARESGDWTPLFLAGQNPTKFTLRPLPAHAYALLADMSKKYTAEGVRVHNDNELTALAFCIAIVRVTNLGAAKIKTARHPDFGQIATTSFFDDVGLEAGTALKVTQEIGGAAIARAARPFSER